MSTQHLFASQKRRALLEAHLCLIVHGSGGSGVTVLGAKELAPNLGRDLVVRLPPQQRLQRLALCVGQTGLVAGNKQTAKNETRKSQKSL